MSEEIEVSFAPGEAASSASFFHIDPTLSPPPCKEQAGNNDGRPSNIRDQSLTGGKKQSAVTVLL